MYNIPLSVPSINGNEWKYVKECLDTEWVSSAGKYVDLFEHKISEYTGAKYAVACVNGTSALHVSLRLAGVQPGDEVITEEAAEEVDETVEEKKVAKAKFERVHIFPLKPFFLPIRLKNNKESGRFLLVTPNFRMSNSHLNGEINKKLPLIREKMYTIFRREKLKDLTEKNTVVQERIKKAVQDRTNELLPVGSGVVKDVFFSQFIIK